MMIPLNVTRMATRTGSMSISSFMMRIRKAMTGKAVGIYPGKEEGARPRSPYIKSTLIILTRGKPKARVPFTCKLFHPFYPSMHPPSIGVRFPFFISFFVFVTPSPLLKGYCLDDVFVFFNTQFFHSSSFISGICQVFLCHIPFHQQRRTFLVHPQLSLCSNHYHI